MRVSQMTMFTWEFAWYFVTSYNSSELFPLYFLKTTFLNTAIIAGSGLILLPHHAQHSDLNNGLGADCL